ncbi:helix-turn-helix transcriptional regulator [Leucobacter komagatae]|uniref:Transcriptional regulator n=1 Tax=Leucobacter komagatae TaxID=55969 RepID=A0A0D0INA6_9MICO|nr:WYL domain-containing protein [Leucobacter komagatae]KIP52577.1 transcriptional regulator [Leucobacter komagatae]
MKRVERLHALSEMLRRGGARGWTADRLAAEFGVSERTIKRDVDALENSGVPIWSRPGPGGGYGVAAQAALPPITLSPAQAVALLAAVSAAPDAPYSDHATVGVRKILGVLDPATKAKADQLAQRIWVNTEDTATRVVQSALEEAMTDQLVVRIRYVSGDGAATQRDVEPVIFGSTAGHWYLIGWCRLRDAMRWFRIARIRQATVTQEPCSGHSVAEVGAPPATASPLRSEG